MFTHLLDDWQNPRLCVIVTVRSDSLVVEASGQLESSIVDMEDVIS